MDWYERLGPARPVIFRNWNMPTVITAEELKSLADVLRADEAGYKNSLNLSRFCKCLYATAKMEAEGNADCAEDEEFHRFYRLLPSTVEMFMTDVPCLKSSPHSSETLLYGLGFLVDLTKFVLASVNESTCTPRRMKDVTSIVRALCKAFDGETPFHQMHDCIPLPGPVMDAKRRYVSCKSFFAYSDTASTSGKRRKSTTGTPVNISSFCKCAECGVRSPESHLWIKSLVEYFGRGCPGHGRAACGFENLKDLLPRLHNLPIELTETVLYLFSRMTEYMRDDLQSNFLHSFMMFMRDLSTRCERDLNGQNVEVYVMIMKHMRCLLQFFLAAELGQKIIRDLENQILRKLLSFLSKEDVGNTVPLSASSTPASLMVYEEVSSATPKPGVRQIVERAADWFKLMFLLHFRRNIPDKGSDSS
ncbi:hypothetical protein R1flu_001831 [Riccia fluitans]|uniref:Uncharacterized protein n=1 Tax=Riccia fluitans TaxID=41844 RepID=A0ABD1Y4E7_9MARC